MKFSLIMIIILFVVYVVVHILLGKKLNKIKTNLKDKQDNYELVQEHKYFNFLFKWFPFLYVLFILLLIIL